MREGDVSKNKFDGLHDRFLRDSTYRDSQLKIGWTEVKCIEMDKLAQENHSNEDSVDIAALLDRVADRFSA